MKIARIVLIGLAALFLLTPCSNAQQVSSVFSFVQKLEPAISGAAAGILGSKTGKSPTGESNTPATPPTGALSGDKSSADKMRMTTANTTVPPCNLKTATCELQKTADPIPAAYPGVSLDSLGIKLGMSVDAVKKALGRYSHSKPTAEFASMSVAYKTITLSSQIFVSSLTAEDGKGGSMAIYFGGPATGNIAVEIDRIIVFPDVKSAPTMDEIYAALDKKYGPVTKTPLSPTKYFRLWVFGKKHLLPSCPKASDDFCDAVTGPYNPFGSERYDPSLNDYYSSAHLVRRSFYLRGNYVAIEANLASSGQDSSRIYKIDLQLSNQANEAISFNEALKQLQAAVVVAYKKEMHPEAAPKL